jgi:hypothetical protein
MRATIFDFRSVCDCHGAAAWRCNAATPPPGTPEFIFAERGGFGGGGHLGGGFGGGHIGGGVGGGNFAGRGMALGRGFAGLHAEARGHFGRDHFHGGRRFGFGGGYDDWCYEYPYYTQNCYPYAY